MKYRYLPLLIGCLSLLFINIQVIRQQIVIHQGISIYVKLRPVDPRSLIQGDYMALHYELHLQPNQQRAQLTIHNAAQDVPDNDSFHYRKKLKITLNEQAVLISSTFDDDQPLTAEQHLLEVKIDKYGNYYPASNSYLFAEGLAYCYEQAQYAELRITQAGKPLLYRLVDEALTALNCEEKEQRMDEDIPSLFN